MSNDGFRCAQPILLAAQIPPRFLEGFAESCVSLGAGGGTRTHTLLPETDFESVASTNSATPARGGCEAARWTARGRVAIIREVAPAGRSMRSVERKLAAVATSRIIATLPRAVH